MSTPRKNFNHPPPFSPRGGHYPSQSADYRSQQFGGQQKPQTPNFGFYEDKQGQPNTPHFYQNKSPQEAQRHRPYGQGRNFGRGGNFNRRNQPNWDQNQRNHQQNREHNQSGGSSGQYFHPSMLEDPWRELMTRHEAIHGSSTSQTPPKEVEAS
ncbi:M-phase-specific PLK1-interacting protein [Drosophila subpulchrella]|uniref:M-phase-specific PLK1-interacting protein n=1 Tax=Drosophila subpulchrella TaxID=1486046 RepID=UPI0018A1A5EB|nr:M-phase-specific PLK1-interacting protein [Drosophila subpulchrella]